MIWWELLTGDSLEWCAPWHTWAVIQDCPEERQKWFLLQFGIDAYFLAWFRHTVDVTYNLSFFFWRNLDPWHIFPVILEKPSVYMLPVRNLNHLMLVWWELLSEDSPEWCAPWQGFEVGCRELLANQGILTSGDVILELGSLQDVSGKFHLPSGIWKQYCEVTMECSIPSVVLMWKVGKPSLKKSCDKRGIDCASTVHSYSWN